MRAIRIHEFGSSSQLKLEDVPVPEPKAGEVRVRVEVCGVNFADIYQRKGQYPRALPFTPGAEFAGIVDALGTGVSDFSIGDRVGTANGIGGYAEYAIAPAGLLVPLPAAISSEQAATVLLQGFTAHYLALSTYPLQPGDKALVHAAAGGVGQLLVQIAKKRGAVVIATVSTEQKAQLAQEAGADHIILYSQEDFEVRAKQFNHGVGLEVVYDGVGKATFWKSLNCLKPRGMMVLYGQSSGPVEPIDPQVLNQKGSLFLTRPTLAHYLLTREELLWRANDLFSWMAAGELKVRVDRSFPLAEAASAHAYMENRSTKGKLILIP